MTPVADAVRAVVRLLVTGAAAGVSEVGALDVSRRAAASIIHVTGVCPGALGVLPADGLHSGANRLPIAVVTTLSRSRGPAALVAFCWFSVAGTPTSDAAAVIATGDVTAGPATGVMASFNARAGLDCGVALGGAAALEVVLTELFVGGVVWAGGEAASPGRALCFRRLVCVVEPPTSLADELLWAVLVCRGLTGGETVDDRSSAFAEPFGSGESDGAELVGGLAVESAGSAPAIPAAPKTTVTNPTIAPTRTAMSRDGSLTSTTAIPGVSLVN